ncbi:sugar ABC transporter permease [Mesorhizobium sp. VK9D]|uniref:carbohydrate ABC transporter permease n=1 Tax=Mesorhizobium australafricanum TaxID=3072311 RepID=UPI002A243826|nr:sugar ABC transporter permease [Mesorhizobium sp. VK9D]MDX8454260.1 sugar ABC transporter permease [Mesorhizobium sp. VK9D]
MVAPMVSGLAVFAGYPLVYLIALAFTRSDLGDRFQKFVGLGNFIWALKGTVFATSLFNAIWFALAVSAVQLCLGLFIAHLLNSYVRGGRWLRALILLPMMTPPVMVGIAWKLMLNPAGGWINGVLLRSGLTSEPISVFGDRYLAFPGIMVADTWQWTPLVALLCFAALTTVPEDVYEAAALDGAYPRRMFWTVTLPMIAPALVAIYLLRLVMAFKTFDLVYALTQGGPGNATTIATFEIWKTAMREFDVGLAAAQTILFALTVSIVTLPVVALFNYLESRR